MTDTATKRSSHFSYELHADYSLRSPAQLYYSQGARSAVPAAPAVRSAARDTWSSPLQPSWNIWGPSITVDASLHHHKPSPPFAMAPQSTKGLWEWDAAAGSVGSAGICGPKASLWHGCASPPLSPQHSPSAAVGTVSRHSSTGSIHSAGGSPIQLESPSSGSSPDMLDSYFSPRRHMAAPAVPAPSQEELRTLIMPCSSPLHLVAFKSGRVDVFTMAEKRLPQLALGDLVVVDADRGRDLGKIVVLNASVEQAAMLKWHQHHERQQVLHQCASKEPVAPLVACTPKQILRLASKSEIHQLYAKSADEQQAVRLCSQKTAERNLDMVIVDAEYQWDRRKLTFFYVADQRVDFRDLVRDLFRTYKTRIWMCAVGIDH